MMINILTLIGIGTVAWILGRLIADLMNWMRRDHEKPNTFPDISGYRSMRLHAWKNRNNAKRAQTHKDV